MPSGRRWSRCCPVVGRGVAGRGPITAGWSMVSCGGPGPGRRGGICRRRMGRGRRCTTGIGAGRATAPGRRCWPSCSGAVTLGSRRGRSGSTRRWSGLIKTLPAPRICPRPMWRQSGWRSPWTTMSRGRPRVPQGAGSNYKKSADPGSDPPPDPPPGKAKPADREALGRSRAACRPRSTWSPTSGVGRWRW